MLTPLTEPYQPVQLKAVRKSNPCGELSRELVVRIYQFVLDIRKETGLGQRSITREVKKKFNIDFSENTVSGWIHRQIIPYANEKTQFKPKPVPPKEMLENLYLQQKLSASTIAKKFNVSAIIAINWLKGYGIKARTHQESMNTPSIKRELADLKLTKPTRDYHLLTPEKAYLLGVLCGDGYIDNKVVKLEIRRDREFIEEFSRCIECVYGLKYDYIYYKKRDSLLLQISSMIMAGDLLQLGNFRTYSWEVPNVILNSEDQSIITSFLRGFYDSEGSATFYCVSITSSSFQGMKGISELLTRLNIKHKLKIQREKYNVIYITHKENLRRFRKLIGFTIKRKMEKLNNMYRKGW